jgi:mannose-6-phosphate isomerase-like protein (cupin superfamily)
VDGVGTWIKRPLSGDVLDPGGERAFVIAEWTDDGSHPGMPIAPPHRHLDEDEAWYVLDGRLIVWLGDDEVEAPAGAGVFAPRSVPHTFANPDARACRYLVVMQPKTAALIEALHERTGIDPADVFAAHDAELLSRP